MGFACPVCDAPQADGEHLANHLAFTAMLHDDDAHAEFLDAHVDDWQDKKPPELAAELIHHAEQTEFEPVFEDTTEGPGMGHGDDTPVHPGGPAPHDPESAPDFDALDDETVDEETQRAIEEAKKLFQADSTSDDDG